MAGSAKTAALRFLKLRPRSVSELKEKLEDKGFAAAEIETAVHDLTASGLLNDRAFTKAFINYRLARPFGFRRIILELKEKGIDGEIIGQAITEARENCSPENIALDLARRRWQRMPDIDAQKKKKRVLDFLLRRGFEADIAMKVIGELK
ncbi:MAG: regulatory protein RecX [Candidatus Omnitrophica bacterium]|nr:regulatory protein RecX [Candidatus Omnitrophota bacterium]MDE2008834.1 regulatory protein RecX [Candidatus Omnitrophota bacterium]MDE2213603.1 regulatory protein RecX [Candidatus Omnitrophota bacterium]MDE2230496.1 regulatory protein RecX [Candidatus Omnitrophota bacterium]